MASRSRFHFPLTRRRVPAACALLCVALAAQAQTADTAPTTTLPTVSVRAQGSLPASDIAGFGDVPVARLPIAVTSVGQAELKDRGSNDLRDLTRLDASVSDAYNSVGYWSQLTVRGYVIDLRSNLRRDGLPISGETVLMLDNKSRVELLKGISGMQSGVSAPGGLVNLVVKRPDADVRAASLELRGAGNVMGTVDWSTRFGNERSFGLRVNATAERLDPELHDARGRRHLLAVAGDWRISPDTLLEAELETTHQSQPSQPGFSLLGDRVPSAKSIDPRLNLNNQPWSLPVVWDADTASLRWQQRLAGEWRAQAQFVTQRLKDDDRVAFPFGCSAEGNFDRYCSDGSFDFYDYRSENERRRNDAWDLNLAGRLATAALNHQLRFGVQGLRYEARFQKQAFNFVNEPGRIDGSAVTTPQPLADDDSTNRDERRTEFYANDAIQLGAGVGLWLGVRHTRLERQSVTTSGTEPTDYDDSFTTPWIAASWQLSEPLMAYASWGQGVESDVAPNRPGVYGNAGQPLPAAKSRQSEIGLKFEQQDLRWALAAFDIRRPVYGDLGECADADPSDCRRGLDGAARHRGIEASAEKRFGAWTLAGSAMWLRARREDSVNASLNDTRPTNVPARSARVLVGHELRALPGLNLFAALSAESDRTLIPGNDALTVPSWARWDIGAIYTQRLQGGQRLVWRAGVDNLADRRAWQESPYQFGHVYLYPMAARTWRLALQADL
ncbi:TonB-dependent siderophore receptor [Caldimonas sp. KR1-144]|uniref:TonB-dependent siderophore receptor n=1 Tax=Caldimonas sp. KR1-144 TaxID=3400911 RepID=UPI003C060AEE